MKKTPGCLQSIITSFNQFKELNAEEEMDCYYRYKNEGNEYAKKMLVESTTKKVMRYVLLTYWGAPDDTKCELLMEMSVGVLETLEYYDPEKSNNAKFSTYAQWRARKRLTTYLSKDCVIRKPEKSLCRAGKIINAERDFYMNNGRYPNYEEIAKMTGLTVKQVAYVKEKNYNVKEDILSLDRYVGEGEEVTLLDILEVDERDLTDLIFEDEIKNKVIEQVDDLIERLPERKKEIVKLRFGLDDGKFKSGSECGAILVTSRQYVNATEADAIKRIWQYGADELAELREMTH